MAQPTELNFVKEDNEFVAVVKKRIRNYKKKMTNIAAIEVKVANKEKIIKEQEDALKSKDTTAKLIQELEHVEAQLLEVKTSENQKQFSLEDVKVLIALMQTQGQVKKVEGVTDQQLKHVQSSANSLLKPSSKWSADDTVKHAHKLVRDASIKATLAKVSVEESKQEVVAEKPTVVETPAPAPVAPVVEAPAPVVAEAPKETPAPVVETAPVVADKAATDAPKESDDDKGFRNKGSNYRGRKPRGGNNGEGKPRNFNPKPRGASAPKQN